MRATILLLMLLLIPMTIAPGANAGVCVGDPGARVCTGYTVLSSDCRFGAVAVNGIWVEGLALIGEVTWEYCAGGLTYRGHSIDALAISWSDTTYQGERSCGIYTPFNGVATDCAYGPPYLPILV